MTNANNTAQDPTTGPQSTSWWLTVSVILTALVPTVWTQITHAPPSTQQVAAVVTGIGAAIALGMKVWHDIQRHRIAAALNTVSTDPLTLEALRSLTAEVGKLTGNLGATGTAAPPPPAG